MPTNTLQNQVNSAKSGVKILPNDCENTYKVKMSFKVRQARRHTLDTKHRLVAGLGFRVLSALRGSFIDTRLTVSLASFDRYCARLAQPHPKRACPVARSRARAAGVNVGTFMPTSKYIKSHPNAV